LTVLVNNASQFEHDTIETANRESWDRHMEVNLRAPFVLSQIFADQVPEGIEGNIVNILDQRVLNLTPFFMTYTVSKTALWTLTQTMAMALAPKVRVNGIGPGPTLKNVRQTEQEFVRQWTELPLRRRVLPEEISDAVRYILLAPSMTGQMIALDGGQHLGWGAKSNMMAPIE
jgi:NAD(P)-dependent dehydrogenase (short-subunit alcohol dehydrogenase family)